MHQQPWFSPAMQPGLGADPAAAYPNSASPAVQEQQRPQPAFPIQAQNAWQLQQQYPPWQQQQQMQQPQYWQQQQQPWLQPWHPPQQALAPHLQSAWQQQPTPAPPAAAIASGLLGQQQQQLWQQQQQQQYWQQQQQQHWPQQQQQHAPQLQALAGNFASQLSQPSEFPAAQHPADKGWGDEYDPLHDADEQAPPAGSSPQPSAPAGGARWLEAAAAGAGAGWPAKEVAATTNAEDVEAAGAPPSPAPSSQQAKRRRGSAEGSGSPVAGDPARVAVFVWDLDETLIIFSSLLDGSFFKSKNGGAGEADAVKVGTRAAEAWADLLFQVLDSHFDFQLVEAMNPVHLDDMLPREGAGADSVSEQHRAVFLAGKAAYELGLPGLRQRMSAEQRAKMDQGWQELQELSASWAQAAAQLLHGLVMRGSSVMPGSGGSVPGGQKPGGPDWVVRHCIVSRGQLLASLVKLMLFGFGDLVSWQDVYSASAASKLDCFRRIEQRYGPGCSFLAAGDSSEEEQAAADMGWPFIRIDPFKRQQDEPTREAGPSSNAEAGPSASSPVRAGPSGQVDAGPSSVGSKVDDGGLAVASKGGSSIYELDAAALMRLLEVGQAEEGGTKRRGRAWPP